MSFVKVAEYQRRAVVHFHALVRLDAPGDDFEPCDLPLTAADLADAIRDAASLVRLTVDLPGSTPAAQASPLDEHSVQAIPCTPGVQNAEQHPMTVPDHKPVHDPEGKAHAAQREDD